MPELQFQNGQPVDYHADVPECPACGFTVAATWTYCPDCGVELDT